MSDASDSSGQTIGQSELKECVKPEKWLNKKGERDAS